MTENSIIYLSIYLAFAATLFRLDTDLSFLDKDRCEISALEERFQVYQAAVFTRHTRAAKKCQRKNQSC